MAEVEARRKDPGAGDPKNLSTSIPSLVDIKLQLEYATTIAMFENLCTLPLSSELFAQALHPTESVLAVGLSGGHVQCFRLPAVNGSSSDDEDADTSIISTGTNTIDTEWRTRRHKGSCRTLAYSGDGESRQ